MLKSTAFNFLLFTVAALIGTAQAVTSQVVESTSTTSSPILPDSNKASAVVADSLKAVDSAKGAASAVDTTYGQDSIPSPSKGKKRTRVVRETTVNTIDDLKGKYRSPKKALFMSLVLPGLGQAYVGQNLFNYSRGAFYFVTEVALFYGWKYYVIDKQDAQIKKYRVFADNNWSQFTYEDSTSKHFTPTNKQVLHPERQAYCEAVQEKESGSGAELYKSCLDPNSAGYPAFKAVYDDRVLTVDSISQRRSEFANSHNFYEMIGKAPEFITGWKDVGSIVIGDSGFYAMGPGGAPLRDAANRLVIATSPFQQKYIGMRDQANDYARMQALFLGGIVINHIVSALDAGLAANYHNKSLYQTQTSWWDRIRLDSEFAWNGFGPSPTVTASLTF